VNEAASAYLGALRLAELSGALALLPDGFAPALTVEIGAAEGQVAAALAARFGAVRAFDVAVPHATVFPVERYDGARLPLPDASAGLIYSSHVMEHIAAFPAYQAELARVMRPGGVAIHVMPSASWRFWTMLAHYPALPRLAGGFLRGRRAPGALAPDSETDAPRRRGPGRLLRLALATERHGEDGTMISEHWRFSLRHWRARFGAAGWTVEAARPLGLFYTGYLLRGGGLSLATRQRLARLLGSSSIAYRVRPAAEAS